MKQTCFGLPSVFNTNSKTCKRCEDFTGCKKYSILIRKLVSDGLTTDEIQNIQDNEVGVNEIRVNVDDKNKQDAFVNLGKIGDKGVSENKIYNVIIRTGINLRRELVKGNNPFSSAKKFRYLSDACDYIMSGSFNKDELTNYLEKVGKSSTQVTRRNTLLLLDAFINLKVLIITNDVYKLNENNI